MLIIASGKCSNSPEFEPFAVRLNTETMLYERDEAFDVDEWRASLDSQPKNGFNLTLDAVLSLLPEKGSVSKITVIQQLQDKEIGVKKARKFPDDHTVDDGPIYEWRLKRSCRPEIHLGRYPQPESS